ncbi:MAG: hypothetical protein ACOH2F_03600 [Cellulomonas sp.]
MAKGLNLSFVSDVSGFLRGTKDIEGALDKVSDSLDDVESNAKAGMGKIGDHAGNAATETGDAADKMERKFRDTFDAVKKDAKSTGDDVGTHTKKGTEKAGEAVGEFKDEARANFSEVASSFTGDMSSAADGVQGIMGGLAGSLPGPAGIAAGVLAGIGGAMFASVQANAEKVEARTQEMYDDMIASGLDYVSRDFINQGVADIFGKTEDAAISWGELQKIVEATGVTQGTVAAAYAGDAESQRVLAEALRGKLVEVTGATDNLGTGYDQSGSKASTELQRMLYGVQDLGAGTDDASTRAAGYATAVQQMSGITQSEQRAIQGGYDNFPREIKTTLTTDTTQAQRDLDAWLANNGDHKVNIATGLGGAGGITRASGGLVTGTGGDIEDRTVLNASPGEYVLDAQATKQIGVSTLDRLNEGRRPPPSQMAAAPGPRFDTLIKIEGGLHATNPQALAQMVAHEIQWALR